MLRSRHALLGSLVSLAVVLATGIPAAQAASRAAAGASNRDAPSAAANGEGVKVARVKNWTVGVAAGQPVFG